ncbi:5'-AMP-activated protein kinase subunit gamma-2 [Channa argus]|uniref:5'-AMP-activated protein kinase subunit gamma-2 n=1 Tax=Channa argus TaxID=215402 RepID=A0A6G1QNJ1_CHAAH|nr:5'-AMP-activated protein kinase subunit gamma-2 [Channa argus]
MMMMMMKGPPLSPFSVEIRTRKDFVTDGKHSREERGRGRGEEQQKDEKDAAQTPHACELLLLYSLYSPVSVFTLQELSVFTMPFLEGDPARGDKDSSRKGEPVCRSASPTKSFFQRSSLSHPSSPRSAPAGSKMSPSSSKTIFPYQIGPPPVDSSPKSPHRLSFSGIFRSASRDSNHQPSLSPVSIKMFTRNKRDKARVSPWNRDSCVDISDPVQTGPGPNDFSWFYWDSLSSSKLPH